MDKGHFEIVNGHLKVIFVVNNASKRNVVADCDRHWFSFYIISELLLSPYLYSL